MKKCYRFPDNIVTECNLHAGGLPINVNCHVPILDSIFLNSLRMA